MGIISSAMLHSWEKMGCLDDDNSEELKTENIKLKEGNKQLYQTLQEIKAIAEKCDLCDDCTGIDDCERYCGDSAEPCATRQMNNILEIINKAESEG